MQNDTFDDLESSVRYYCRRFPSVLQSAKGATLQDENGGRHIDMLSACGALNYGHAHPHLKEAAISFLETDGVAAGLDLHTTTKRAFLAAFEKRILRPRGLSYRMQFPGPTGSNCVEAALKLARKFTERTNVVAFTNGFHGVSMGALSATGSSGSRRSVSSLLHGVTRLYYDGYLKAGIADLERFEVMTEDPSGGIEPVAAFIVECVQGEGGLNVASIEWLRHLAGMCRRLGALLIIDEIQTGCGRTGPFFAFERAGIVPDIVCLAKSISGYGFPMSLLLMRPEVDVWHPGEHNGTFRGNSIAFATATAALDLWSDDFIEGAAKRASILEAWTLDLARRYPRQLRSKGIGLMRGLQFSEPEKAIVAARSACAAGILLECCGPRDEVLKLLPALNIEIELLLSALNTLSRIVVSTIDESTARDDEQSPRLAPTLESDETSLDSGDDGCHAIVGT